MIYQTQKTMYKGEGNPFYGKKHSEETINKIKATLKQKFPNGRPLNSGNWKKGHKKSKKSHSFKKGRIFTEEQELKRRKGISLALTGKTQSEDSNKKRSLKMKGRKIHTDEFKKRQSILKLGDNNPSKQPEIRKKQRLIRQKQILEMGGGPNIGKNEIGIIKSIELSNDINIIRQYPVCGYFTDGYNKEYNIVFEVDEKPKITERDIRREKEIKEELNCEFVRIEDEQ